MDINFEFVHSCIRVMDLKESVEFYQEALNLEVVREKDSPENKFTLVYMRDQGNNFELELTYNYDREEPYVIGDGYSHIAVLVDDLEQAHHYHADKGYKISEISKVTEDSKGLYFLTDPDGFDIEIVQR